MQKNKSIVKRLVQEFWNEGKISVADELFDSGFVNHDPSNPGIKNLEGYKQWASTMHNVFPDFDVKIEDMIEEDNKVVKRYVFIGTHKGEAFGIPPTGNKVTMSGITIYRIQNEKITECWWNYDFYGYLQQIGVIPQMSTKKS